jgi:hypothetical protein
MTASCEPPGFQRAVFFFFFFILIFDVNLFVRFEAFTAVTMTADEAAATCSRWFLACRFFYPEDRGDTILRNVGSHRNYTAPQPRKWLSSNLLLFPKIQAESKCLSQI